MAKQKKYHWMILHLGDNLEEFFYGTIQDAEENVKMVCEYQGEHSGEDVKLYQVREVGFDIVKGIESVQIAEGRVE